MELRLLMWGSVAPQRAGQLCIYWQEEPLCCKEESERTRHDCRIKEIGFLKID
jgi:hypothetical protein